MKKQILKMINTILIISFIVLSSLLVAIPRANAAEETANAELIVIDKSTEYRGGFNA